MPAMQSVQGVWASTDNTDPQTQPDEQQKAGNRHRLSKWGNKFRSKARNLSSDQSPEVPPKNTAPPAIPKQTSESNTPIADAQIFRVLSRPTNGIHEAPAQLDINNLAAELAILQEEATTYREERDKANHECSQLKHDIAGLKREKDEIRGECARLNSGYDQLNQTAGNLHTTRETTQIEITQLHEEVSRLRNDNKTAGVQLANVNSEYFKLQKDLEEKVQHARQAKKIFDEERKGWNKHDEATTKLQSQVRDLQARLQSDSMEHQVMLQLVKVERDKLKPFETKYNDLVPRYNEKFGQLDQRSAELLDLKQQHDEMLLTYRTAGDELHRLKLESSSTLGDDFFIRSFRDLQGAIKQLANSHFRGGDKKKWQSQLPKDQQAVHNDLLLLSHDAKELLFYTDAGIGRSSICEAYIWKFIEEQVFDGKPTDFSKGMYWAHDVRADLCRLEKFLRPGKPSTDADYRPYHKWRACTTKLLVNRLKPSNEHSRVPVQPSILDYLVDRALEVLEPWMMGDRRACVEDLTHIIQSAIDFDSHVNEQWSIMCVCAKPREGELRYGFALDDSIMEGLTKGTLIKPRDPVELVVSPALLRYGTASGDDYSTRWTLVKGKVLPQMFSARSQRSKVTKMTGMAAQSNQRR